MQDFQFEASSAVFPIVASRWEHSPQDACIFYQNEKARLLYGELCGRRLVDLFSDVLRERHDVGQPEGNKLLRQLIEDGHVKNIGGSLAGKKVELFSCLQKQNPNTIQTTIFDITARFMDHLSGIPGRELFYDHLELELYRARREKSELHVCFLDLDGFKQTNDLYGHKAGDDVIVEVAERLKASVRRHETVARFGGDEFVVLLTGSTVDSSFYAEKKLIPLLNQPYHCDGHTIDFIGASIGISYIPMHEGNADDLVNHADDAMYVAKERGKNQVVVFEHGMEGMKKH